MFYSKRASSLKRSRLVLIFLLLAVPEKEQKTEAKQIPRYCPSHACKQSIIHFFSYVFFSLVFVKPSNELKFCSRITSASSGGRLFGLFISGNIIDIARQQNHLNSSFS